MVDNEPEIRKLQEGLGQLENFVLAEFYPTTALKIAGSRIDIAFSTQVKSDVIKAQRALETAKLVYEGYRRKDPMKGPLYLINEMRRDLSVDYPGHHLLD